MQQDLAELDSAVARAVAKARAEPASARDQVADVMAEALGYVREVLRADLGGELPSVVRTDMLTRALAQCDRALQIRREALL